MIMMMATFPNTATAASWQGPSRLQYHMTGLLFDLGEESTHRSSYTACCRTRLAAHGLGEWHPSPVNPSLYRLHVRLLNRRSLVHKPAVLAKKRQGKNDELVVFSLILPSPSLPTRCASGLVRPSLIQPSLRTLAVHNLVASHPLLVEVESMRLNSSLIHRLESLSLQAGFTSLVLAFARMASISSQCVTYRVWLP